MLTSKVERHFGFCFRFLVSNQILDIQVKSHGSVIIISETCSVKPHKLFIDDELIYFNKWVNDVKSMQGNVLKVRIYYENCF